MLHEEQNYVFEIGKALGYELKLVHHKRPTISCAEKLDLLKEDLNFSEWTLDRIVKALYFSRNNSPFIGIITPEFNKNIEPRKIFPKVLEISNGIAERYWIDPNRVPNGMNWGTCTPFPLVSSVGTEISDLIFLDHSLIMDKLVDISVGGTGKEMFQTSMHIPYIAIYEILRRQFGNSVHLYST